MLRSEQIGAKRRYGYLKLEGLSFLKQNVTQKRRAKSI